MNARGDGLAASLFQTPEADMTHQKAAKEMRAEAQRLRDAGDLVRAGLLDEAAVRREGSAIAQERRTRHAARRPSARRAST
jgi:hypothetical protein